MGLRKCCVGGCTATSETHQLFLIPKNDNLRALWLTFLVPTNPLLTGLNKSQLINKRVCSKHFDKQQFDDEGRRLRYSYPCLFSDWEIALGEPRSTSGWSTLNEHNYFSNQSETIEHISNGEKTANTFLPQPSCSITAASSEERQLRMQNSFSDIEKTADTFLEQPSSSFTASLKEGQLSEQISLFGQSDNRGTKSTLDNKIPALKKIKPKKGKLTKKIVSLSGESLAKPAIQRLEQAQNILNSKIIENYYALPKYSRTFIQMQLKNVNKKKMAHRFTFDEKLFALAVMKQSPKGYRLLEKMFTLPNKRMLNRVSENINFEPGLNPHIFEHIKNTIKNWNEKERICSILYDEISLTPHLAYDENKDAIIGFVDINGKKKMAFCDHALVFMIRGICASWRQCIAYYFVEGTVAASDLKEILNDVVMQIAQTGLIPLALVSDQGSTFRTTIYRVTGKVVLDPLRAWSTHHF